MRSAHDDLGEAYKAFEEAFFRGEAEALATIYADDAEWLVPGAPPIRGRAAIAAAWKGVIGTGGNTVRVDVHEVRESGDWAFDVRLFTTTAPEGPTLNAGKYIVVGTRHRSAGWQIFRDIFHWDIPPGEVSSSG